MRGRGGGLADDEFGREKVGFCFDRAIRNHLDEQVGAVSPISTSGWRIVVMRG
jgi:hypothetical protein